MNISAELEKLVSLRDYGDLSEAEFEKAKRLLLTNGEAETRSAETRSAETLPAARMTHQDLAKKKKKCRLQFIAAIFATLTVIFSGISVGMNSSPLKIAALILWVVVSALTWSYYAKLKIEIEREKRR